MLSIRHAAPCFFIGLIDALRRSAPNTPKLDHVQPECGFIATSTVVIFGDELVNKAYITA